ncbi:hypothetical protein Salat_1086600 [Sesamum alatum]|uniref:Uncharacterized protein n=1 Tax=Sesamum alatum TaxID=300844 RepID=A0AAE1YP99_9LAMI|nr:hypothetical protein Salat_1086600 [Sesamum alatum]
MCLVFECGVESFDLTLSESTHPQMPDSLSRAVSGSLLAEAQKSGEASKVPEIDISELESLFSARKAANTLKLLIPLHQNAAVLPINPLHNLLPSTVPFHSPLECAQRNLGTLPPDLHRSAATVILLRILMHPLTTTLKPMNTQLHLILS